MKKAQPISPAKAVELMRNGALLVDLRETEERDSGFIAEARHAPLSTMAPGSIPSAQKPVIFHCRTGKRTTMNEDQLCAATTAGEVYLLDGGFDAWASSGMPTTEKGS